MAIVATLAAPVPAIADTVTSRDISAVTASMSVGAGRLGRKVSPPQVLGDADLALYEQIFDLQRRGQWALADRARNKLSDDVLDGYVLAQRYLHPLYKVRFGELKAWLDDYADHPAATDIHSLAKRRMGEGDGKLKSPVRKRVAGSVMLAGEGASNWEAITREGGAHLEAKARAKLRRLEARFRSLIKAGELAAAAEMLSAPELTRLADKADLDAMAAVLASHYFSEGNDSRALALALPAAERSGDVLPQVHWTAGMAQWRMGRPEQSRRHFEAVANADGSPWMVSAGAYWAARANLLAKRPQVVNHWLEIAASHPRTFYGLLARRALGLPISFTWESTPFTDVDSDIVLRTPTGRRALALLQLGKRDEAEEEMRRLAVGATPALARAMLSLAHIAEMPELALVLGGAVAARDGRFHDNADFPVPGWTPSNGWTVDRALVLAFARQESGFDPRAKSPAGAVGLMQLMPATARHLAGGSLNPEKLFDPTYNLALGQAYIQRLLADPVIDGNLFKLAAAYNSGPGNLGRWLDKMNYRDDPLLFIESMPSRETRGFVEKVMTNLWIYRARLGQPMTSLDAVVAGDWPLYEERDRRRPKLVKAKTR